MNRSPMMTAVPNVHAVVDAVYEREVSPPWACPIRCKAISHNQGERRYASAGGLGGDDLRSGA